MSGVFLVRNYADFCSWLTCKINGSTHTHKQVVMFGHCVIRLMSLTGQCWCTNVVMVTGDWSVCPSERWRVHLHPAPSCRRPSEWRTSVREMEPHTKCQVLKTPPTNNYRKQTPFLHINQHQSGQLHMNYQHYFLNLVLWKSQLWNCRQILIPLSEISIWPMLPQIFSYLFVYFLVKNFPEKMSVCVRACTAIL